MAGKGYYTRKTNVSSDSTLALEEAINQEIGTPTPQNDLPNLKKDRIVLELTNRTNQDQTINLFALPTGINPEQDLQYGELLETFYSQFIISIAEITIAQTYTIDWIDQDGVSHSETTGIVATIGALISELISETSDNWDYYLSGSNYVVFKAPIDTYLYWNPPPPPFISSRPAGTQPASFYTKNNFTTITANTSTNVYTFATNTVIGGTGVSVVETTGNLSYSELVQALRNNVEPYLFNTMTIYAPDIDQANTPITKVLRGVAGNRTRLTNYPTVLYQTQFVVTEEIALPMEALYQLQYVVNALNTVTIIITYTKGNLNAIAGILDAYIEEGLPFNVAIEQLEQNINEKEREYLEATLRSIWERKQKELKRDNIEIDIENIFNPQEVIDAKKQKNIGEKMKLIKKLIEEEKANSLKDRSLSKNNIKNLVANYAAKVNFDESQDPYNYMDGMD